MIVFIFKLATLLMFLRLVLYVKSNSKDGRTPVKYGRFQRNVLTLNQILIIGIVYVLLGLRIPLLSFMNTSTQIARTIMFASNLVVANFLMDIVVPILILVNLKKAMPEFYKISKPQKRTFYVTAPLILPRRDIEFIPQIQQEESPIINNIIFVKSQKSVEAPTPKMYNNITETSFVDNTGKRVYMKYLTPVE